MYMRFFGLKQEPFSLAPDPRYLYMSKRHREALAHLLYGVGGGGGFVLLSGEIGAGKTTVCRCFLEQIPKRCNVAYIFNPKLTVLELVKSICDEFHIPAPKVRGTATVKTYVDALNDFLLRTHAVGQNNVLIIDEAQQLSAEVLEQLRLLTNLETNERKLLQIVLIGQPELRTMLERPDLEQLAQRVIARFHLKALTIKETEHYIRHRLSVAGMTRAIPFDRKALQRIHEISRGVPRRINLLCDRVMLGAYAHGKHAIDHAMVEKAGAKSSAGCRTRRRPTVRRSREAPASASSSAPGLRSPSSPRSRSTAAGGRAMRRRRSRPPILRRSRHRQRLVGSDVGGGRGVAFGGREHAHDHARDDADTRVDVGSGDEADRGGGRASNRNERVRSPLIEDSHVVHPRCSSPRRRRTRARRRSRPVVAAARVCRGRRGEAATPAHAGVGRRRARSGARRRSGMEPRRRRARRRRRGPSSKARSLLRRRSRRCCCRRRRRRR
jgi:type II secretory pathway predicted ATPase ExeA